MPQRLLFWRKLFTFMTWLSFRRNSSASGVVTTTATTINASTVALRLECALWSFLAGDALASPTHWYYGGYVQIDRDYPGGVRDYTKPVERLAGSILNKSNLQGGGRSSSASSLKQNLPSIIGEVINHGKQNLWSPDKSIHYHATLQAGENTLEVQLARILMKSIVQMGGVFDEDHFRQAYIDFMTTPGSHNDTYASTCHRMFFANLVHHKLPPKECPDNDYHNVDTIDGLVLPSIVSLAAAARGTFSVREVQDQAAACAAVTRKSVPLQRAARSWSSLLHNLLLDDGSTSVEEIVEQAAHKGGVRLTRGRDHITACYLDSAYPALLNGVVLYSDETVWNALLANANVGGENVHRGSCLGAALGARHESLDALGSDRLITGLIPQSELSQEIRSFVAAVMVSTNECAAGSES